MSKNRDDYEWKDYTSVYRSDTERGEQEGWKFLVGGFDICDGIIIFREMINTNIQETIYQIWKRKALSVFECGCGAGWQLRNILKICPEIEVSGCDITQSQIDFGQKYFTEHNDDLGKSIYGRMTVLDFSLPVAPSLVSRKFDFVFCNAVLMHLSDSKAIQFIKNMASISSKYFMMTENTAWNDFPSLIERSGVLSDYTMEQTSKYVTCGFIFTKK